MAFILSCWLFYIFACSKESEDLTPDTNPADEITGYAIVDTGVTDFYSITLIIAAPTRDWEGALDYAENLNLASHADWRLPNTKELQSIADYSRSPQATNSPAINPIFETTEINDPEGNPGHFPFFWTSTTHLDGINPYSNAVYFAFGEGLGKMNGNLMDVHGAGCQRSDPKSGNRNDYPQYHGPQGDVRYVYNYVRAVRTISK
ncbi:MAG: DUF1566 domain-containing protein [Cytophagales bacterium]|nr:DUF1566 domain-containing protein [Cytophagales bacterium]